MVASSSLIPAVFLCQQLLVNICPPSLLLSSIRIRCREASRLTASSVGTTGMQEQNSMAVEKTFKIISFKVLPWNDYFLTGGKVIFPKLCPPAPSKKKMGVGGRDWRDNKNIFLKWNRDGRLFFVCSSWKVRPQNCWEVGFYIGVPVRKTLVLSGSAGNKNVRGFNTS